MEAHYFIVTHPELAAEQAYIDHAYEALEEMRRAAALLRDSVIGDSKGGTHQARYERDVFVGASLKRLEQLEIGNESLVFGRMDTNAVERFYVGRLAVAGPDRQPLVVDWRAPVAEAFYRATGAHPMDLTLRRHFLTEGRAILLIEDERFDGGEDLGMAGPGALLAALERTRTGQMRDIVSTIQREQDEIIRGELPGVLVVQGGPGTGKTAVALHRAAYLLFTHRRTLERQGLLVVGPNQVFLRYIDRVLPALGESGVAMTTVDDLFAGVRPMGRDTPELAKLKADARMIEFVDRAVRERQRALVRDATVVVGQYRLVIDVRSSAQTVHAARRRPGTHNARRPFVESSIYRRLYTQYTSALGRDVEGKLTFKDFVRTIHREPVIRDTFERMWPTLTPQEFLHDLYGAPPLIALAGRKLLTPEECEALYRKRSDRLAHVEWTPADASLLDEAYVLLGPLKAKPVEPGEEPEEIFATYGHIVVDEAQDLSPMQLRMLARRSLTGSMTLVGDVAQSSRELEGWSEILAHLPSRTPPRSAELSVNYRTPEEVMDIAARVLREAAPHLTPPRSVRSSDASPTFAHVPPDQVPAAVVAAALSERAAVDGGLVAVLCPEPLTETLEAALAAAGVEYGDASRDGLEQAITVIPARICKGLEFDSVVLVSPAQIAAELGPRGLYVALTRTTRRLAVVHAEPLPTAMVGT